jgi:hypothetical protein
MDWPFGRAHEVPHAVEIVMVGSPACHLVRVEHVRAGYAIACEQTTVAHRHDEGVQIRRILEDLEADGCGARGGDLALAAGVQGASGGPGAFAATRSYSTTGGFCSIVSPTCRRTDSREAERSVQGAACRPRETMMTFAERFEAQGTRNRRATRTSGCSWTRWMRRLVRLRTKLP